MRFFKFFSLQNFFLGMVHPFCIFFSPLSSTALRLLTSLLCHPLLGYIYGCDIVCERLTAFQMWLYIWRCDYFVLRVTVLFDDGIVLFNVLLYFVAMWLYFLTTLVDCFTVLVLRVTVLFNNVIVLFDDRIGSASPSNRFCQKQFSLKEKLFRKTLFIKFNKSIVVCWQMKVIFCFITYFMKFKVLVGILCWYCLNLAQCFFIFVIYILST